MFQRILRGLIVYQHILLRRMKIKRELKENERGGTADPVRLRLIHPTPLRIRRREVDLHRRQMEEDDDWRHEGEGHRAHQIFIVPRLAKA